MRHDALPKLTVAALCKQKEPHIPTHSTSKMPAYLRKAKLSEPVNVYKNALGFAHVGVAIKVCVSILLEHHCVSCQAGKLESYLNPKV